MKLSWLIICQKFAKVFRAIAEAFLLEGIASIGHCDIARV